MKKIILLLLIAIPLISFTQEKVTWDYPVKPGSEEWKSFQSSAEMVESCQIPNDILHTLSTDDLVNLCLRYPMFLDIHFANNIQDGLDIIISRFNGFVELYNRIDCPEVLMDRYFKETPGDVKEKKNNNTMTLFYLELLISQEQVIAQLDKSQRNKLFKEALKKINIKRSKKYSTYYELGSALILSRLLNSSNMKNKIDSDMWLKQFNKRGMLIDSDKIFKIINIAQEYVEKNE
jgi:hypothetical protein